MIDILKWDRRMLRLAEHVSSWSKDPSTKVGAILATPDNIVVGMGYNGFARGVKDTPSRYEDRDVKYKLVVHAEVNACVNAGLQSFGTTLYVWPAFGFPCICHECCKVAIQSGVARIVGAVDPTLDPERAERWKESLAISRLMCEESGVLWDAVTMEDA